MSFPTDILQRVEDAAGDNVSGWVTQACREKLDSRAGPPDIFAKNILVDLVSDTLGKPAARELAFFFEQNEGPAVDQTAELHSILFAYLEEKRREQRSFVAEPPKAGTQKPVGMPATKKMA